MPELYIGLMSGTSMDAIDAVLADFAADAAPAVLTHVRCPIPPAMREPLLALCASEGANELENMARLDVRLGRLFAETALTLLRQAAMEPAAIRAIGSHGQTVRHSPSGSEPYTVQIGDPNVIAEITGITTVADFRRRDVAAGGQGAPLVPAFHQAVFQSRDEDRVVLNIGGMANITLLPRALDQPVSGFDTGPGNVLLDTWAARHLGQPLDEGGRWAAGGAVHTPLLERLLDDPYFKLVPPKSTGREYFNLTWLTSALGGIEPPPTPQDVQATLCVLTAASIARAIGRYAPHTRRVLACGGGVHNVTLMEHLARRLDPCSLETTSSYGLEPQWVEATAFAWLAKQTLELKAGNLPSVTGARRRVVLGGIYAGRYKK